MDGIIRIVYLIYAVAALGVALILVGEPAPMGQGNEVAFWWHLKVALLTAALAVVPPITLPRAIGYVWNRFLP